MSYRVLDWLRFVIRTLLTDVGYRIKAFSRGQGMRVQPQCSSGDRWINTQFFPPPGFITAAMDFTMMTSAKRNGELIADLAPHRAALGEAKVMGISGLPPADQAGVRGDKLDVFAVTMPPRLRQRQDALVNRWYPGAVLRRLGALGLRYAGGASGFGDGSSAAKLVTRAAKAPSTCRASAAANALNTGLLARGC